MGYAVTPISPSDVGRAKVHHIPDVVFEAFNELIAVGFISHNSSIIINQDDVINLITEKMAERGEVDLGDPDAVASLRRKIYDKKWLNIEEAYRAEGWDVFYDKPAYFENYSASFKFSTQ